jgi:hypothetical protein
MFLVLIGHTSRYLCSRKVYQLPNEIIHRRRVGAHPRSHRAFIVYYWMKASVQTFASTLICRRSPSICPVRHSIIEISERSPRWVFSPFLLPSADCSFWNVSQWQNISLVRKFVPVREELKEDRLGFHFVPRISTRTMAGEESSPPSVKILSAISLRLLISSDQHQSQTDATSRTSSIDHVLLIQQCDNCSSEVEICPPKIQSETINRC